MFSVTVYGHDFREGWKLLRLIESMIRGTLKPSSTAEVKVDRNINLAQGRAPTRSRFLVRNIVAGECQTLSDVLATYIRVLV